MPLLLVYITFIFFLPLSSTKSPSVPAQELHIVKIRCSFPLWSSTGSPVSNTWYPAGGIVLDDCGTSRRWNLAGGSWSLRERFEDVQPSPTSWLLITDTM